MAQTEVNRDADWMDVDMAKVDAAVEMPIKLNQEDE